MKVPFLGSYDEIHIGYDVDHLVVEVDGRTPDGFWESILLEEEINDPLSYALGIKDMFSKLYKSIPVTVLKINLLGDESVESN